MKRYLYTILALALMASCQKEKKDDTTVVQPAAKEAAPAFSSKKYTQKTTLPCTDGCTSVAIDIPVAENIPAPAKDSINKKIFGTVRSIVYFGEEPSKAESYEGIMETFIKSYDELRTKFPKEKMAPWEAKIEAGVPYQSDKIINVKMLSYMFTGGAHGYSGYTSLVFDATTGKAVKHDQMFTDREAVAALAEKKFREKYKIQAGKNINNNRPAQKSVMFQDKFFVIVFGKGLVF